MKVTITIEEEEEARVRIERGETGETVTTPVTPAAEAKPTSAGGPPEWLLQELQGEAAEAERGQPSTGPVDAGPAPTASGNGFESVLAELARGS